MDQIQGYPRNLAWNLKKLAGSIIKQKIKISADQNEYKPNQIIRINFPIGRMIDLRSAVAYSTNATTSGTGGIHFTRGGFNSLIQNLAITANGRNLQTTNDYNFVWNLIADLEGYYSPEQATKRITELFDPSVSYTYPNGEAAPVAVFNVCSTSNDGSGANDSKSFCVNNWLGFFNGSVSTIDTNNIGNLQLSITLANSGVLFYKTDAAAGVPTDASYSLKDVFFTVDTLTFTNSLYYDLVKSQLEGGGLNLAYYDYIVQQLSSTAKSTSGINVATQINANSLDQVIATFRPSSYDTIGELLLGSCEIGTQRTYNEIIATPVTTVATGGAGVGTSIVSNHGAFNNVKYFRRDGSGYDGSTFYINSQPFTTSGSPIECFNNSMISLNYNNLDIGSGGLHAGCHSLGHFCRNYFADILSLENCAGDNNWWVSGLSGNGGTIQIQYNAKFKNTTDTVFPVIICRVSKVLNIKMGRALDVME